MGTSQNRHYIYIYIWGSPGFDLWHSYHTLGNSQPLSWAMGNDTRWACPSYALFEPLFASHGLRQATHLYPQLHVSKYHGGGIWDRIRWDTGKATQGDTKAWTSERQLLQTLGGCQVTEPQPLSTLQVHRYIYIHIHIYMYIYLFIDIYVFICKTYLYVFK